MRLRTILFRLLTKIEHVKCKIESGRLENTISAQMNHRLLQKMTPLFIRNESNLAAFMNDELISVLLCGLNGRALTTP